MAFVSRSDIEDRAAVRRFAVAQALRVNAEDHERRCQTEELWQHLHLRGVALMARRGLVTPLEGMRGFGVAAGA